MMEKALMNDLTRRNVILSTKSRKLAKDKKDALLKVEAIRHYVLKVTPSGWNDRVQDLTDDLVRILK